MTQAQSGSPHLLSRWTANGEVALHYLDSGGTDADPTMAPLLFVPGFGEEALDHLDLIAALAPRRVLVPDLRGRGPSGKPDNPYDLAAHVGDVDAVVRAASVDRLHVASYSRGTAYALRWAVDHRNRLASISVGDYPAAQIAPPHEVIPMLQARERFGRPFTDRIPAPLIAKIIEQAHTELYYDDLAQVEAPLLVLRGTRHSAMVKDEILEQYRAARPDVRIIAIDDGHDLWKRDPEVVPRTLRAFMAEVDASATI